MPTSHDILSAKVDALKADLPRISFGYIGNCGVDRRGMFDERTWYVFLPHYGRCGTYNDSVHIGSADDLDGAVARWPQIEARARQLYAMNPNRIAKVALINGELITDNGHLLLSAQYRAPLFKSIEEAEAWLVRDNYPATVQVKADQWWNSLSPTEKVATFDRYDR